MTWQALVDAALLGTARGAPPELPPEFGHLDDGTLLTRAALLSRARRAGAQPFEDATEAPPPAEDDGRPHLHASASRRCAALLENGPRDLLHEWVELLAASGRRPPPALVPALLELGRTDPALRERALPLLGPLGPWLAAQNPEWRWAAGAVDLDARARERPLDVDARARERPFDGPLDGERWSTAAAPARRALFTHARETRPDAARALLEQTWATEAPAERAGFVALLRIGLSPADEGLLETALRDRRADVRRNAAELLASLPGSAFAERARARAARVLRTERKLLRTVAVVEPPTGLTAGMRADGLDDTPPRGTGLQAHLLRQVVAAAPVAFWHAHTGLALPDLVGRLPPEWAAPVVSGLRAAAARDADADALDLLFAADGSVTARLALLGAAPAEARAGLAVRHRIDQPALLDLVPGPWPPELTRGIAASVSAVSGWQATELLNLLGRRGDPAVSIPLLPDTPAAARCQALLHDRAAARRELLLDPEAHR